MGHDAIATSLLADHCADVNARNKDDSTPLHCACHNRHSEVAMNLALVFGADANVRNINGDTPLHSACILGGPQSYLGDRIPSYRSLRLRS